MGEVYILIAMLFCTPCFASGPACKGIASKSGGAFYNNTAVFGNGIAKNWEECYGACYHNILCEAFCWNEQKKMCWKSSNKRAQADKIDCEASEWIMECEPGCSKVGKVNNDQRHVGDSIYSDLTLEDCKTACLRRPTCEAITWKKDVACYLHPPWRTQLKDNDYTHVQFVVNCQTEPFGNDPFTGTDISGEAPTARSTTRNYLSSRPTSRNYLTSRPTSRNYLTARSTTRNYLASRSTSRNYLASRPTSRIYLTSRSTSRKALTSRATSRKALASRTTSKDSSRTTKTISASGSTKTPMITRPNKGKRTVELFFFYAVFIMFSLIAFLTGIAISKRIDLLKVQNSRWTIDEVERDLKKDEIEERIARSKKAKDIMSKDEVLRSKPLSVTFQRGLKITRGKINKIKKQGKPGTSTGSGHKSLPSKSSTSKGVSSLDASGFRSVRGSTKSNKGSIKSNKGSAKSNKGSAKSNKGSAKSNKGSTKSNKGSIKSNEGSIESNETPADKKDPVLKRKIAKKRSGKGK